MDFENRKWRGRIFRYAPFFLWLGIIVYNSSSQASMSETSRFIRPLLEFLFPQASEQTLSILHGYIRKFAHLAEYSMLAFLASRAFWGSRIQGLRKYWPVWAMAIVLLVAPMDEINQSFDPSRTGSIYDVILDCIGGFLAVCSLAVYKRSRNN